MSSSWHGATKCHQVFEAKWYMGFFGQLSCKRHIGYSNARSFFCSKYSEGWVHDCSTTGGNDKSGSGRAQMQQVQVWTANFYRGEKEPQEEPDARLHVLQIL